MNTGSIIVVTGGNRGIGFEICRQLSGRGARVVLTARKPEAGAAAVKKLAAQNLATQFHPLDVTATESLAALRDFLERTCGRLDVLINNAGIISEGDAPGLEVDMATVRATLETNALAPLHLSQTLVPLLKRSKSARIVNVSSGMGALSEMEGGYAAYRISKTTLNAVTTILAAELRGAVAVNSACPGWVRTDMGGPNAERDVAEGAATAVWLALDAPQDLSGKFVRDGKVIPW
ncbi:MAG: SDR family oxidoreductase [Rhodoplanes sp.]